LENVEFNEKISINAIFLYGQLVNKSVEVGYQQFYDEAITFLTEINTYATENKQDSLSFMSRSELDRIKAIKDYISKGGSEVTG
jgi:uncharacterized Zn finger protein